MRGPVAKHYWTVTVKDMLNTYLGILNTKLWYVSLFIMVSIQDHVLRPPVLGEWTDSSMFTGQCQDHSASPALQYVWNSVLQSWCTQSRWVEEALEELRVYLGLQLKKISSQGRGRALGELHTHTQSIHMYLSISETSLNCLQGIFCGRKFT